jgi:ABC-type multidrug transport system ATPase subunit
MSLSIQLNEVGKIYHEQWVFKGVKLSLQANIGYHINGQNGSGKSTLLKLICGFIRPSVGDVTWKKDEKILDKEHLHQHFSWAAPYTQLFDTYNLKELFDFFASQQAMLVNSAEEFAEILDLKDHLLKPIKNYSSGMQQRVKLGLAILSDTEVLLLDEPSSNLDESSIRWFQDLLKQHKENRILIVASNNKPHETIFCTEKIEIESFKSA